MQVARLVPGDVLYIPKGWWHYVASPIGNYHISVNCWFGREQSLAFFAAGLLRLGPRYVARLLRDFFMGGVVGLPVVERFHLLPDGVKLYRALRGRRKNGDSTGGQREDTNRPIAEEHAEPVSSPGAQSSDMDSLVRP
jgi:hypothetical protein